MPEPPAGVFEQSGNQKKCAPAQGVSPTHVRASHLPRRLPIWVHRDSSLYPNSGCHKLVNKILALPLCLNTSVGGIFIHYKTVT